MTTDTDLLTLIGHDVPLRKIAATHGGEFAGPCPFCHAGVDRFRVWPNAARPGWWCRHCEKGGDAIQYLREKGYSYADACHALGRPLDLPRAADLPPVPPVACEAPPQKWREAAAGLVFWAQGYIDQALPYLTGRGLAEKTIRAAGLGYNPAGRWSERSRWGLPKDEDGNERLWIPAGIVIPWYVGGHLWKISIRRDVVKDGQDRYKTLPGSSNALYNADALQPGRPAALVEGPFDALAVQQAAGDLCGAAACGTSGARRIRWISALALCEKVLVALDADDAGDHAARYWLEVLPNARRLRPYYGDPAQLLQDGQDVRGWLRAGLGGGDAAPWATDASGAWAEVRDYWRGEVAANSAALERLARICRERGYDYEATVEVLRG